MSGKAVRVQCARVPITFEGKKYERRVAVATGELVCDSVLFAVPMAEGQARKLLLDAALEVDTSGVGNSGDTPDIHGGIEATVETLPPVNHVLMDGEAGEQQCLAVTRSAAKSSQAATKRAEEEAVQQVTLNAIPDQHSSPTEALVC